MLKQGDKVALTAPSGCLSAGDLDKAAAWFAKQGITVEIMPHVFACYRYMAGSDQERAADINACFERDDIKAVFCVRGGAGSGKILDMINYDLIKKNPKPIFGLSDSTALQNALYAMTGNVSYTGFLPIYDFKNNALNEKIQFSLQQIFQKRPFVAQGGKCLISGQAEGIVVGGCLSVFCQLCGTPYFPDLKDKILLLEDVGEKTYKIELMLNQLRMQKNFAKIKGVVFGQFLNCLEADKGDGTIQEILNDFAGNLHVPTIYDFDYGHQAQRYVLPIGGKIRISAVNGEIEIC